MSAKDTVRNEPSETRVQTIFRESGEKHGFTSIHAMFEDFPNMTVKWRRANSWIELRVTDYLEDAPESVLKTIAEQIFGHLSGETSESDMPQEVIDYVGSAAFRAAKRPIYLSRIDGVSEGTVGNCYDLNDCLDRLKERGLVPEDLDVCLRWFTDPFTDKLAVYSSVMKYVGINSDADTETMPEEVLDFLVYKNMVPAIIGYDPGYRRYREAVELLERYGPEGKVAEKWLQDHSDDFGYSEDVYARIARAEEEEECRS